jgi:hypothetical protein
MYVDNKDLNLLNAFFADRLRQVNMAASSRPNLDSELEHLTSCSICLEPLKDPRFLPCAHTFCRGCLQDVVDKAAESKNSHIACPLCQTRTPIPKPPEEFPKAFFFTNLCEILQKTKSSGNQKCHWCLEDNDEEVDASWICLDCAEILCNQCKRYHMRNNKSHLCTSIADLTSRETQQNFENQEHSYLYETQQGTGLPL